MRDKFIIIDTYTYTQKDHSVITGYRKYKWEKSNLKWKLKKSKNYTCTCRLAELKAPKRPITYQDWMTCTFFLKWMNTWYKLYYKENTKEQTHGHIPLPHKCLSWFINWRNQVTVLSLDILTLPIRSTSRSDGDPYNSNQMKESRGLKLSTAKKKVRSKERQKGKEEIMEAVQNKFFNVKEKAEWLEPLIIFYAYLQLNQGRNLIWEGRTMMLTDYWQIELDKQEWQPYHMYVQENTNVKHTNKEDKLPLKWWKFTNIFYDSQEIFQLKKFTTISLPLDAWKLLLYY